MYGIIHTTINIQVLYHFNNLYLTHSIIQLQTAQLIFDLTCYEDNHPSSSTYHESYIESMIIKPNNNLLIGNNSQWYPKIVNDSVPAWSWQLKLSYNYIPTIHSIQTCNNLSM